MESCSSEFVYSYNMQGDYDLGGRCVMVYIPIIKLDMGCSNFNNIYYIETLQK